MCTDFIDLEATNIISQCLKEWELPPPPPTSGVQPNTYEMIYEATSYNAWHIKINFKKKWVACWQLVWQGEISYQYASSVIFLWVNTKVDTVKCFILWGQIFTDFKFGLIHRVLNSLLDYIYVEWVRVDSMRNII